MARRKSDSPQKAAMREMMQGYLKENDISIKSGNDVNSIMRDMMSVLLEGALDEELNEELGYSKYDYRNQETDNSRNGHSKKTLQRVPKESASMCMSRRMKNTQYLTWKCRQPLREICPNGCDIIRE